MITWAQIVDDHALNVFEGDDFETEFGKRFVAGFDGGHPGVSWEVVPDGTASGAKSNGDGTFTNPPAPESTPTPRSLTKAQFEAHLAANDSNLETTLANWPAD